MNAQERALAKAKEKVEEILWESPEGVSISALTGTLRISKPLAISALAAIGAVEQNGVWVLPDDEVVEPEQVAPGAKADMAVVNENFTTELYGNSEELPKVLDQSMFDILPSKYRWATINIDGSAEAWVNAPDRLGDGLWDAYGECISLGGGFDGSKWRDIIQRESFIDEWGIENFQKECKRTSTGNPVSEQKQDDEACPMPCVDQPVKAPSDYSPVFNNILDRVLQTIKTYGGATADRVRELTGMHPDDIEDAVQFMVDHGQLVGRSVYFATVYEVAA